MTETLALLAPLKVEVRGLVVPNTNTRQVSTRHNPERYESLWREIHNSLELEASENATSLSPMSFAVVREKPQGKVVLGSFEVDLVVNEHRYPIFSKVRRGRFPSARYVVKRVRSLLGLELRTTSPPQIPAVEEDLALHKYTSSPGGLKLDKPLHRIFLKATDAFNGCPIFITDDLQHQYGASLTCTDSAGYQLSILSEDTPEGKICFVEAEEESTIAFAVRHGGWELVEPSHEVFVDTCGPAILHLVAMRSELVSVRIQSLSGCPLGAGVQVQVTSERRGLKHKPYGLASPKVQPPLSQLLITDSDGGFSFQEFWGTLVEVQPLDNDDWTFTKSPTQVFVGRENSVAPKAEMPRLTQKSGTHKNDEPEDDEGSCRDVENDANDENFDAESWIYDSCDEDEKESGGNYNHRADKHAQSNNDKEARPLVATPWTDWKANQSIEVIIQSARPRYKWCTLVFPSITQRQICMCTKTQSRGGVIVRIEDETTASSSIKGWCTCCCEGEKRLKLRQTLGYQALARGAPLFIRQTDGTDMPAQLVRRSTKGMLQCRPLELGSPSSGGGVISRENIFVSVDKVAPGHVSERLDVWRAMCQRLLSFSGCGYTCARRSETLRIFVQGLKNHPALKIGAKVRRFTGAFIGELTGFNTQDQWIEFKDGIAQDLPHAAALVIGDDSDTQWMRADMLPLQVSVTIFCGGVALQTFGFGQDGRQGDWTCYFALGKYVRVLPRKSLSASLQQTELSTIVVDFRPDSVMNFSQQPVVHQAQTINSFSSCVQQPSQQQSKRGQNLGQGTIVVISEEIWLSNPSRSTFSMSSNKNKLESHIWTDLPAPRGVSHILVPVPEHADSQLMKISIQYSQIERTMLEVGCSLRVDAREVSSSTNVSAIEGCQSPCAAHAKEQLLLQGIEELAACRLQAYQRCNQASKTYNAQRSNALMLQTWFRFRVFLDSRKKASTCIQKAFRQWKADAIQKALIDQQEDEYEDEEFDENDDARHVHFKFPPEEIIISPVAVPNELGFSSPTAMSSPNEQLLPTASINISSSGQQNQTIKKGSDYDEKNDRYEDEYEDEFSEDEDRTSEQQKLNPLSPGATPSTSSSNRTDPSITEANAHHEEDDNNPNHQSHVSKRKASKKEMDKKERDRKSKKKDKKKDKKQNKKHMSRDADVSGAGVIPKTSKSTIDSDEADDEIVNYSKASTKKNKNKNKKSNRKKSSKANSAKSETTRPASANPFSSSSSKSSSSSFSSSTSSSSVNSSEKSLSSKKSSRRPQSAIPSKRQRHTSADSDNDEQYSSDLTSLDSEEEIAEIEALRREIAVRRAQKAAFESAKPTSPKNKELSSLSNAPKL